MLLEDREWVRPKAESDQFSPASRVGFSPGVSYCYKVLMECC